MRLILTTLILLFVLCLPARAMEINAMCGRQLHRIEVFYDGLGVAISYQEGKDRLQGLLKIPVDDNWGFKLSVGPHSEPALYYQYGNLLIQATGSNVWIGVTFRS